ncbi:hypothetical protein [Chamaesiphon minutus]|uniref:hypothetical protein n=1 Tax=Chamaesiphon minutus TaxID=1173032 RepID=UPI0002F9C0D5|nr:hypothetical protein [Chamaesiphon minutus]
MPTSLIQAERSFRHFYRIKECTQSIELNKLSSQSKINNTRSIYFWIRSRSTEEQIYLDSIDRGY